MAEVRNTVDATSSRIALGGLALGYLLFVVYGSLVPLEYRPMPFSEALERFRGIHYLHLGIGSRADWVANILLFVPLTFLFLGLFWPRPRGIVRLLISMLVLIGASLLSLGIEFIQLFFPPRTVSQNDILAETLGAAVGIVLWWWRGPRIQRWIARSRVLKGRSHMAEHILWVYLAVLFLYNVLPLDLTISPVEIYHKWSSGKVNLVPFGFAAENPAQQIYNLITDILIWVPVSLLWVVSGWRQGVQAFAWTVLAASLLEVAQFFVFSRVTDVTDILAAMVGAGLGVWLARFLPTETPLPLRARRSANRQMIWPMVGFVAWTLVLLLLFWFPFDFRIERTFLGERIHLLERVPFHAYYYGTEYRAVTELLHKILFFMPLGALLAVGRSRMAPSVAREIYQLVALGMILAVPAGVELGQIALPGKNPDTTDWVLEVLGGAAGYLGLLYLRKRVYAGYAHRRGLHAVDSS